MTLDSVEEKDWEGFDWELDEGRDEEDEWDVYLTL